MAPAEFRMNWELQCGSLSLCRGKGLNHVPAGRDSELSIHL